MADRRGGEYLQGVVAKTRATGLVNFPQLTKNDYELFGEFIEVYSFIDFNLRRFMEVLDFRPRRAACAANRSKIESAAAARAVGDRSTAADDRAWEALAHMRHQSPLPMYENVA